MKIGVPKEIKKDENRVGMTPDAAAAYVRAGHEVWVETGAGLGIGADDQEYRAAGARIAATAAEAWSADMIVKVKEPQPEEYEFFREGQIIFAYFHLAPLPELAKALLDRKVIAVAYETVQLDNGSLPLLTPMSEVAGRMSVQIGARFLEKPQGGKGVLLGGVPGVEPAKVTIIGGGTVGTNAAKMAVGLGADVTILDIHPDRLRQLDDLFRGRVKTLMSNPHNIAEAVRRADLVIGAVLIPGARAPKLVTEQMVRQMSPGSVIVDVAIDQGGSIETANRTTTHENPVYEKFGVLHYAVPNIPGAVPRTSTLALSGASLPYGLDLAGKGWKRAALENPALGRGINTAEGKVTHKAVAEALGFPYTELSQLLKAGQ